MGGWSAHTHTALVKPPCPSNRVQIQIITNQIFLWPFRGFRAKINRCFKTPGIPKSHMSGTSFCLYLFVLWISNQPWRNPHCCLSRRCIDPFRGFILSAFFRDMSGEHCCFFLAFALHFKFLLFVLTNIVVILPKWCDHVESINYFLVS